MASHFYGLHGPRPHQISSSSSPSHLYSRFPNSFPNLPSKHPPLQFPPEMSQLLAGSTLVFQDGSKVPAEEHLKDKVVGLYFSAGWCGPCHRFTPLLKKFYDELKEEGVQNFEVVFLSWDESAEEQEDYFSKVHGLWARLEHSDTKNKDLGEKFEVNGIPTLKLVTSEGKEVVGDGASFLRAPSEHYCDVCRDQVEESWFKCQNCEDYDLCSKCKTHLVLSPEHQFKEITKADLKAKKATDIWAKWMEKYNEEEKKANGEQK